MCAAHVLSGKVLDLGFIAEQKDEKMPLFMILIQLFLGKRQTFLVIILCQMKFPGVFLT